MTQQLAGVETSQAVMNVIARTRECKYAQATSQISRMHAVHHQTESISPSSFRKLRLAALLSSRLALVWLYFCYIVKLLQRASFFHYEASLVSEHVCTYRDKSVEAM